TSSIVHETTHQPLLSRLSAIVETVLRLKAEGHKVVIPAEESRGCSGTSSRQIHLAAHIEDPKALAAIGQGRLIALWDNLFGQLDQPIAQILLTRGDIADRTRYLNAVNTLSELLSMGVVPIVNENDTISVSEIKFGDNDTLSAITSSMLHADYLFLLTDVDGLYTTNPRKDPTAKPIDVVTSIQTIRSQVSIKTLGSKLGTGGMETKLIAAEIATAAGVTTIISSSAHPERIFEIIEYNNIHYSTGTSTPSTPREPPSGCGSPAPEQSTLKKDEVSRLKEHTSSPQSPFISRPPHTMFTPSRIPLRDLKSWTRDSGGRLLPAGVLGIKGRFASGQAVRIMVRKWREGAPPVDEPDVTTAMAKAALAAYTLDSPLVTRPGTPALLPSASMSSSITSLEQLPQSSSLDPVVLGSASQMQVLSPVAWEDEHHEKDDDDDDDGWELVEVGRGLANYNSAQIKRVKGMKSSKIANVLGYADSETPVIVLLGSLSLLAHSTPLKNVHLRQLPPIQITWANALSTVTPEATTTVSPGSGASLEQQDVPVLVAPPFFSFITPLSVSISTSATTLLEILTSTMYESPETITVSATPTTVTETITVTETFTATPGSFWAAPAQFSDLSSFKVSHFACGEHNLQIITGISPNVSDTSLVVDLGGADDLEILDNLDLTNSSSALQLFYPANSINPGNSPQGGADFYATPLPLGNASNVTLEYSVYFPDDFDWVNGGKLPGLYGGHMTCSGGDDATTCFSTRLMWRAGGAGELYLYAPKDKQTYALCHAPPESVCDAAYGLSVGRGSFKFIPGAWTNVRQSVSLNTPGEQDGGFRLEVNGKLIMDRSDVFYRNVPSVATSTYSNMPSQTGTDGDSDADSDDGGLLSPLLGGVLSPLNVTTGILPPNKDIDYPPVARPPLLPFAQPYSESRATNDAAAALIYNLTVTRSEMLATALAQQTVTRMAPSSTITIASYLWEHPVQKEQAMQTSSDPKPIGFSGLFFR
ncbi:hypothetical protein EW145_g7390, partial [Phellinidium pouzarii]